MNWPEENSPQNPEAVPVFDEWGWADFWDVDDWLEHHMVLKEEYGEPQGNDLWMDKWNQRTGFFEALGDARADWISFNTVFRDHLADHIMSSGRTMLEAAEDTVLFGSFFGNATETVTDAGGAVKETVGNLGGTLVNTSQGMSNFSKQLSWLLPLILIVGLAAAAYFFINSNPLKAVK